MEDVIERLREENEPVPVPLELPDEDLLVEIEEELLISLPPEFREFLLTVSDVVYGRIEPVTVTDPQSHTYLPKWPPPPGTKACRASTFPSAPATTATTASARKARYCCGKTAT